MSEQMEDDLTGAQALIATLADNGVRACFANPGTSEMHLVSALDAEPRIRSVLCLFEGVASGAADGFARITGTPALTLLHLGPGYLNAGANIHNALKAGSPMINLIGDHAVPHLQYEAPLTSDILALAGPNSVWIKSVESVETTGAAAAEAYMASLGPKPGPVSVILPADLAWGQGAQTGPILEVPACQPAPTEMIRQTVAAVRAAKSPVILINGSALSEAGLQAASRLKAAGIRLITDTFFSRMRRGSGVFAPERLLYFAEGALSQLDGSDLLITAGTQPPVAFFSYPGKPSSLVPGGCDVIELGGAETDSGTTLALLADALGANTSEAPAPLVKPNMPSGALNAATIGQSLARHMPHDTIVCDDGVSNGFPCFYATMNARAHDWMMLTGGAIGDGIPMALGAAIAAPERKIVCLTGDGAALYTNQALWSLAREGADVTVIVFVNHDYRILNIELQRTGAGETGATAKSLLSLGAPEMDWVSLSKGLGVPAVEVTTPEAFDAALSECLTNDGPHLIAALLEG
ncbi:MAG: acetolactate synthase large subunit [Henriciella sp.]